MLAAVSVAVTAVVPVTDSEVGTVQVTGLTALAGAVVTAQLRATVPVNPFEGVMLTVDVLPVVAPAVTAIAPLFDSANVGVAAALMVTLTGVVSVKVPDFPVTVNV